MSAASTGNAAGSSEVSGKGAVIAAATGIAGGSSSAVGEGGAVASASGSASGTSTAEGVSEFTEANPLTPVHLAVGAVIRAVPSVPSRFAPEIIAEGAAVNASPTIPVRWRGTQVGAGRVPAHVAPGRWRAS